MILKNFLASFSFDERLAIYDITGSIAHVKMLAKCKIVSAADAGKIVKGLQKIQKYLESGKNLPPQEDIHYAIEKKLIELIGEKTTGRLRTARSRNDQIALDLRLYLKDRIMLLKKLISDFQENIIEQAKLNEGKLIPGYTHLQPAEPVLFSHYILSYAWMLQRDKERLQDCYKRADVLPLGSAALAGTSFPIDRQFTAKLLGFSKVSQNSMDSVSDRDFIIEFLSAASITMMHLSRLAEEIIIWINPSFNFIEIDDEYLSGSSIMPQKKNPDFAELVRGKTGRVYGSLIALLTLMKGLPLTYNRDLQEDKPPLFDAIDTLSASLEVMAGMVVSMKVRKISNTEMKIGFMIATELANYLVKKGMPFKEAHSVVKNIVNYCRDNETPLENMEVAGLKKFSSLFDNDVKKVLSADNVVNLKISEGGSSIKSVRKQITELIKIL
ncbi:MAG: argininosuccinate lyase [Elusimicrobiota bacterium]